MLLDGVTGRERLDRNDGGLNVVGGVAVEAASGEFVLGVEQRPLPNGDSRPEELSDVVLIIENKL